MKNDDQFGLLMDAFKHGEPSVRLGAERELVRSGLAAIPALSLLASSGDLQSRIRAIELIGSIDDASAIEPLIDSLGDRNYLIRSSAVKALGKFKSKQAVEQLLFALSDVALEVRDEAVKSLSSVGSCAIVPLCYKRFDPNPDIGERAKRSLDGISPTSKLPEIVMSDRNLNCQTRFEILREMRELNLEDEEGRTVMPHSFEKFVKSYLNHPVDEMARGAREIMDYLALPRPATASGKDRLLRPSGRGGARRPTAELLRPAEDDKNQSNNRKSIWSRFAGFLRSIFNR